MIRCTARVAQLIKAGRLPDAPAGEDDWYVNVVTVARRRVVLALQASTLFPVIVTGTSAAELRDLPSWLTTRVGEALADEGLSPAQLGSLDTTYAVLVRTSSRKALGHLNQIALELEHIVGAQGGWGGVDVAELNRQMRRSLRSRDGGYVVPLELARARNPQPAADALLAEFRAGLVGRDLAELQSLLPAVLAVASTNVQKQLSAGHDEPGIELLASIDDAVPPIQRTLVVAASIDLLQLHQLLQQTFGWEDYHLFRWARDGAVWDDAAERYLCPFDVQEGEPGEPARGTKLSEVLSHPGEALTYLYDYGDNWQVTVTALSRLAAGPASPMLTSGTGAAPPEDCGGIHAWNAARDAQRGLDAETITPRKLRRSGRAPRR